MALAALILGSVILPRSESPEAISRLAEFEWFHNLETQSDTVTPEIDDLLLKAQKLYQSIDEVVKGLQIPPRVGILEILFKGTVIKKTSYELDEIENMIEDLEEKSLSILKQPKKLLDEYAETERSLEEYTILKETIEVVRKLNVNLSNLGLTKYFYTNLFVIDSKDYGEIARSLQDIPIFSYALENKQKTAIIILTDAQESETVLKILRSFNSNPFIIPPEMPQVPTESYVLAISKIKELSEKEKKLAKEISKITKKIRGKILTLQEGVNVAKDVLEKIRKPGGTKRFAVIRGYIPKNMEKKFKQVTKKWMSVTEDITDPEIRRKTPVLLTNKRWIRTFEVITESQGIPRRFELDPTPMIAIMWPIFYGIMFADFAHGILLMCFGLLFKFKGQGKLSRWGMLIGMSGASGAIAGLFTGEFFGFHIAELSILEPLLHEGGALHSISWLVGIISVAELTFEQVIVILKVSIFLGIVHIVWAFILKIRTYIKEGNKTAMFFEAIPNLIMYLGIVAVMMAAIGSSYDIMNIYSRIHTEAVPWVTILVGDWAVVWIVSRIAIVVVIGSIVMMIIGGILHNKKHPEEGGDMASVMMEVVLGKTVEGLSHTISYARIGIMLLVHAALLLTVNNAFHSLGEWESPGAIAMIVGGNLGIMLIEGLIVYIQSLRLHLYEFFTKWYGGGGEPFRKVVPEIVYNQLVWKKKS
ncbi:MAG: ATPase [Thaumarchaeota archaeon]|nr:ATPase [Nitrososphaerota archaeon]